MFTVVFSSLLGPGDSIWKVRKPGLKGYKKRRDVQSGKVEKEDDEEEEKEDQED